MRSRPFMLAAGLVAFIAAIAPASVDAQNQTATAVQLPTGAYLVAIQPTDSLPTELAGDWRIVFEQGGTYRVLRNGGVVVLGEYRTVGDTLRLVDKSGEMACTDAAQATYVWKAEADGSLRLVAVEDACAGRQRITTLRALVRAKRE